MTATLRRYGEALFSQGAVSIFHFAMNLVLVRAFEPVEYGAFALAFVASMILAAVINALFTVPLSVLAPGSSPDDDSEIERNLSAPALALGLLFAMLGSGIGLLSPGGAGATTIAASFFVGSFTVRHHMRGAGYARFDTRSVLWSDVLYVVVSAIGLAFVTFLSSVPDTAGVMLGFLVVGNLAASALLARSIDVRLRSPSLLLERYRPYWDKSKWALVGAVATMVVTQGHSVIIGSIAGAAAFAPIAAGFVLFGPVRILFATVQNVLRPEMAKALATGDRSLANRMTFVASVAGLAMVCATSLVILLGWGPVATRLFDEQYGDEPMAWIVAGWGVVTAIAASRVGPNALLQAQVRFAELARAAVLAGGANIIFVTTTVLATSAPWTIPAVGAAELAMTVLTLKLLLSRGSTVPRRRVSNHGG